VKPRVLFVGRTRYRLPLPGWLERKWSAVGEELDLHVLASAEPGDAGSDPRFSLIPAAPFADGVVFYARLPFRVRRAIRALRPEAIVAEDPRTASLVIFARRLAGPPHARVICEVHGEWRHSTRLYGSGTRHVLTLFAEQPVAPFPDRPTALFVGVLERYKNVDGLVAAWRTVARELPEARLVVVGKGPLRGEVEALREDVANVELVPQLVPEGVARALDEATVLVLPSRHEGLGRVVIEAFARGRGVVASRAGGVLDLVDDGVEGLLVDPEDTEGLADALTRVLSQRDLAEWLGAAAFARFDAWNQTAEEFAYRIRNLVDAALH
jgi:glycosyltransferase involved in cell wall biosynthesis